MAIAAIGLAVILTDSDFSWDKGESNAPLPKDDAVRGNRVRSSGQRAADTANNGTGVKTRVRRKKGSSSESGKSSSNQASGESGAPPPEPQAAIEPVS